MKPPKWFKFTVAGISMVLCLYVFRILGGMYALYRTSGDAAGSQPDWGALCLAAFAYLIVIWVGSWRIVSERDIRAVVPAVLVINLLPSLAGFLFGYYFIP